MNWLLKLILSFGGKRMSGYKTQIGGIGLILTGLSACFAAVLGGIKIMFPDLTQLPDMETSAITDTFLYGTGAIGLGFAALGIGHKSEKQTAAINSQTTAIVKSVNKNTVAVEEQCDDPTGISPK